MEYHSEIEEWTIDAYKITYVYQRHHAEDLYFSQNLKFCRHYLFEYIFSTSACSLSHGIPFRCGTEVLCGRRCGKETGLSKVCNGSFHLEGFLEESKTVMMENRLVAARGWGGRMIQLQNEVAWESFPYHETVKYLDYGDVYLNIHFKIYRYTYQKSIVLCDKLINKIIKRTYTFRRTKPRFCLWVLLWTKNIIIPIDKVMLAAQGHIYSWQNNITHMSNIIKMSILITCSINQQQIKFYWPISFFFKSSLCPYLLLKYRYSPGVSSS